MNSKEVFEKLKSNPENKCDEAIRILVKVADNILQNPTNLKIRSLKKTNSTVQNKILTIKGGLECLKLMGFEENDTSFELSANSSVDKLKEIKTALLNVKVNDTNKGAIPKQKPEIASINKSNNNVQPKNDDLKNVKRFVLPPFVPKFTNPFLRSVEAQFHQALAFDDKDCQERANNIIPLHRLQLNAQTNLRNVQTRIKKEKIPDPELSVQDMLLLELLTWFKEEFFSWVDSPPCEKCGGTTVMSHMSSDPSDLVYTSRVEVHKCQTCQLFTKFPRYNDLNILLETRKGRCGEWAQVFTLLCRSLGWDARYVVDEQDHVWTEVYSVAQKRWIHCDSCENACDTPLMYESGWNKKLTYVMAYSPEEVQDVTWRYTSDHKEILQRRNNCKEEELVNALMKLRSERQKKMTKTKEKYLTRRIVSELVELMVEQKPHDREKQGRISGSEAWRSARGEMNAEKQFYWALTNKYLVNNKVSIKYSAAKDVYKLIKGDDTEKDIEEFADGAFDVKNVFRKEEKDWKMVYLARNEGSSEGIISWRIELEPETKKVIDTVTVKLGHTTYEDGTVEIKLISDDIILKLPKNESELTTNAFSGHSDFTIQASLKGGKGDVAWQHAQLFRQSMDSEEYPFVICVTFVSL